MTLKDLEFRIEILLLKKRKLTREIDDIDSEIIGCKEQIRNIKLKSQSDFSVLTEIEGEY